jgi:deoxyribonuclease-4
MVSFYRGQLIIMGNSVPKLTLNLGVHVSISGSLDKSVDRAVEKGCTTFQMFTRNPRGWRSKDLDCGVVERFKKKLLTSGIDPVFAHMPYLPNLASPDKEIYSKSVNVLVSELKRCERLGVPYLVVHMGSHRGSGTARGVMQITAACRTALDDSKGDAVILFENTAGTKNSVGGTFEDIASVMDGLGWDDQVGLCFDTCHAFVAGYELRSMSGLRETLRVVDRTVSVSRLELVHLNDSRGELNSRLDRHEHIGLGGIGIEGFRAILNDGLIRSKPMVLETPVDRRRNDWGNLTRIRSVAAESLL